jgi:hypothetical protein
MGRRLRIWEYVILTPIFLLMLPLGLVLLSATYLVHMCQSIVLRLRLRYAWPAQTWILLSYTQSAVWAPFLEFEIIPRLGKACMVIDRSSPDWKQRHPIEAKAIEHWGGYYEHNPLIILLPRWRPAKVVRPYKAFLDKKHGKPQALETEFARLFALVEAQQSRHDRPSSL